MSLICRFKITIKISDACTTLCVHRVRTRNKNMKHFCTVNIQNSWHKRKRKCSLPCQRAGHCNLLSQAKRDNSSQPFNNNLTSQAKRDNSFHPLTRVGKIDMLSRLPLHSERVDDILTSHRWQFVFANDLSAVCTRYPDVPVSWMQDQIGFKIHIMREDADS